jgi:hypothetical protein
MAAGQGFKTFVTGDVLTAADTNGYLMQGVLVFATAAARDSAITSPQEGQTCYLKDTDVIQCYSGSSWVTKSGSTAGLTLITRQTFTNVATTTTTFDSVFSSTYTQYLIRFESMYAATAANDLYMQMRTVGTTYSGANYMWAQSVINNNATTGVFALGSQARWVLANEVGISARPAMGELSIGKVGNASEKPVFNGRYYDPEAQSATTNGGYLEQSDTYTGFILSSSSSNITGTVSVYGLAKS